MLRTLTRSALVLLPLLVCAGRLHAQRSNTPHGVTQEVNRCLTVVRVAASRRRGTETKADPAAARRNDHAAPFLPPSNVIRAA